MEIGAAQEAGLRIDEHFDRIRANLIRCEECSENFFFDFLRHPRYFVTHFKTCHLKNVLYRFNGCSEEENQRVRFGPRRKKDATAWFGQLKSTEKRMISMQDNKWGEIAERECWSCRLCKGSRKASDLPHAFEPNELGRRQALLHLRQYHEAAYNAFLRMLPAVDSSRGRPRASVNASSQAQRLQPSIPSHEAERSRIRRKRASPEARKAEAERSRRRRAQLTPAQRQVDAERRARKKQRIEERARSRARRADASPETKEREMQRSRERRQNATEQQRRREAQRSRMRRQNASEEQRIRERERCRRRYELKKQQMLQTQQTGDTVVSELQQQQAGVRMQLQSLYDSLASNPHVEL
ncbi:hypothetical protein PHYSODRAFT_263387 [Phytophthora sojae]|uniref:Uncharacterized protein n=1 Tax=Phytophthora sojae (strain P6497) TaxID=1094619 RepID=G4YY80_PHYSP|nr:hypothetical protein PHYSODRAFT_263387 [Phytophthora sojae]EGZ23231.1 hypothetical protein PHYSODRAFT_263387 [Phytophthora sojae]|eukprot:XP_009518519.1 hypothetical protein PHYSODRAFT_263387 [Phytophthora sojae]